MHKKICEIGDLFLWSDIKGNDIGIIIEIEKSKRPPGRYWCLVKWIEQLSCTWYTAEDIDNQLTKINA